MKQCRDVITDLSEHGELAAVPLGALPSAFAEQTVDLINEQDAWSQFLRQRLLSINQKIR